VVLVDEDLGLSGSSTDKRSGFARLTSEVALAHVGIVLGLEVSRLARNNADWYRLLELCGVTDTLIGDNDGVYHPALFNDRLLLGLNRPETQSTSHSTFCWTRRELLLPSLIPDRHQTAVIFDPSVPPAPVAAPNGNGAEPARSWTRHSIQCAKQAGPTTEMARRVWLWFRSEGLSFPLQTMPAGLPGPIRCQGDFHPELSIMLGTQEIRPPIQAGAHRVAFQLPSGSCRFLTDLRRSSTIHPAQDR